MIESFGADAVRLFILSDSPPEKDVQWSDGMIASFKFIQKFWLLNQKLLKKLITPNEEIDGDGDEELNKFTNQLINKMNNNLEKFNYNVIVANMYETYNFLSKIIEKQFNKSNLLENYRKILSLMSPVIPHVINECLETNKFEILQKWPYLDKKYLEEKMFP